MKVFEIKTVTVDEVYNYLNDYEQYELQEEFNNLLDESQEDIEIFGVKYSPSHAFMNIDIIRYQIELDNYILGVAEQIIEEAKNGETVEVYNCSFQWLNVGG